MTDGSLNGGSHDPSKDIEAIKEFLAQPANEPAAAVSDGDEPPVDPGASVNLRSDTVAGRCRVMAGEIAAKLNSREITFAHLLLAMTQDADAYEKLKSFQQIDVAGARKAAKVALADLPDNVSGDIPESAELKAILIRAQLSANDREQKYQSDQPIAVQDIVDAVLAMGFGSVAQKLLGGRLPASPLLEIKDSLIFLKGEFAKQIDWNLGIARRIVLLDERVHKRLDEVNGTVLAQSPPLLTAIKEGPVRRPLLIVSGVAGVLAAGILAGYALASTGVGPKLFAWLGQWIV